MPQPTVTKDIDQLAIEIVIRRQQRCGDRKRQSLELHGFKIVTDAATLRPSFGTSHQAWPLQRYARRNLALSASAIVMA